MQHEGPPLEQLVRRLTETPADFLAEPRIGTKGTVHVPAVAADLFRAAGWTPPVDRLRKLAKAGRNDQQVALLLCWLLAGAVLEDASERADEADRRLQELLADGAAELAAHTPSRDFVDDAERREELARFALARLDLRPQGETVAQAEDRLRGLSVAERTRVMEAARAAEQRAQEIREALRRKAAQESADKWTRE